VVPFSCISSGTSGHLKQLVHEVLVDHVVVLHAPPEGVEIGLKLVIGDGVSML
jgi:hypothetical protein